MNQLEKMKELFDDFVAEADKFIEKNKPEQDGYYREHDQPTRPEYYRVIERGVEHLDFGFIYSRDDINDDVFYWLRNFEYLEPVKKPEDNDKYWFVGTYKNIEWEHWGGDNIDNFRWATGNVFQSKESVKKHLDRLIK